ncbi:gamma-glutamyltransferase [Notoacmeibacter marinus]|nr:gamma-glutamyltransferase [Notoacmeibacter marinus]
MTGTPRGMLAALLALALFSAAPLHAQQAADAVAPEKASEASSPTDAFAALPARVQDALKRKAQGKPVTGRDWMIAVANPHAAEAGAAVLEAGGTAADAMVAAQAMLGLVEPQSSGLGGGAFLVWYDAAAGAVTTLDGRETAPMAATPKLFLDADGAPLDFFDAVVGGRSVGVPGVPALMEEAHRRWGKANWPALFEPTIALANDGFPVSPRLAELVAGDAQRLDSFAATSAYFLPGGRPIEAGASLRNPAYAATLRALAEGGADAFYRGPLAEDIVRTVRQADGNPGRLALPDLASYAVKELPAVCVAYRAHEVCGMGPPSSGGVAVGQILGLLAPFDLAALSPDAPEARRLLGDAARLAFADRGRYLADSDFVPVPVEGLIDPAYLRTRSERLKGDDALPDVAPGEPEWDHAALDLGDGVSPEQPSTTHLSIVDRYGNALAMTSSIENAFGSRLFVGGFLLNNQLTDFSFATHEDGRPIANRAEPGKRPRSSMAPTIVLKDGTPRLAIGSPGGSRIIPYVANAIVAHLDWGLDAQAALALPHAVNRFGTYDLEEGTAAADDLEALEDLGFEVAVRPLNSGLHAIAIAEDGALSGGADPRREGIALGE